MIKLLKKHQAILVNPKTDLQLIEDGPDSETYSIVLVLNGFSHLRYFDHEIPEEDDGRQLIQLLRQNSTIDEFIKPVEVAEDEKDLKKKKSKKSKKMRKHKKKRDRSKDGAMSEDEKCLSDHNSLVMGSESNSSSSSPREKDLHSPSSNSMGSFEIKGPDQVALNVFQQNQPDPAPAQDSSVNLPAEYSCVACTFV